MELRDFSRQFRLDYYALNCFNSADVFSSVVNGAFLSLLNLDVDSLSGFRDVSEEEHREKYREDKKMFHTQPPKSMWKYSCRKLYYVILNKA